jgi:ribose 5-phosphate isomerase B
MIRVAIGGDHAGFEYKAIIKQQLEKQGYDVTDYGPYSSESADYPDYVHPLCNAIEAGEADFGVLICGSANGVAITANKHQKIRAAICWQNELAALSRQHNNANIICLPARFISTYNAQSMVEIFLTTDFEGGRHARRVSKIACAI